MSWMEYKLLTQAEVDQASPPLPSANSLGGQVYVNLATSDGSFLMVAGTVVAVDFTAAKVRYSVAFQISPPPRDGLNMYAVVENIPSDMVATNTAGMPAFDSVGEDVFSHIEVAAHEGALGNNSIPEPSDAQKAASNYKVGRATLHGMDIAIEQPRGTIRSGTNSKTGVAWSNRMAAHYGYLSGTTGADGDGLDVFIGVHPESTAVYVINQVDPETGAFDEHKIMLGMCSQDEAVSAYQNSYDQGWKGLGSVVPATIDQLKAWVSGGNTRVPLTDSTLPKQGFEKMTPITWTGDAPDTGTYDTVLYDIRRHDLDGLLLDSVSMADIMEDAEGTQTLDALVTAFSKLPSKMAQLQAVMEQAGGAVKPVALQITDPFNQRGTANVAAIFELSDGQTLTIYFHNPDTTPTNILPTDELISWKWMLNKLDITIVAAPDRGDELSMRVVASRVMRLAAKNSPAFQRANVKRAERMQSIAALKEAVTTKEAYLASLQKTLEVRKIERETIPAPIAPPAGEIVITDATPDVAVVSVQTDGPVSAEVAAAVQSAVATITGEPEVIPDPLVTGITAGAIDPVLLIAPPTEPVAGAPPQEPIADPIEQAIVVAAVEPALIVDVPTDTAVVIPPETPIIDPLAEAQAAGAIDPNLTAAVIDADPTSSAGYAAVMADPDLQVKWQDKLDAFFQARIAAIRFDLYEFGWCGFRDKTGNMGKNGMLAKFEYQTVGAGNNIIGYAVKVMDGIDIQAEIGDCLKLTAGQVAQRIDAIVTNSGGSPPEPENTSPRITRLAEISGKTVSETLAAYEQASASLGADAALALLDKTIADYETKMPVPIVDIAVVPAALSEVAGFPPAVLAEDPLPEPPVGTAVPIEMQTNIPAAHLGENPPPVGDGPITYRLVAAVEAGSFSNALQTSQATGSAGPDEQTIVARAADVVLIQSVVDGQADVWDSELAAKLDIAYGRIQDDADLVALWKQAITVYTNAMLMPTPGQRAV